MKTEYSKGRHKVTRHSTLTSNRTHNEKKFTWRTWVAVVGALTSRHFWRPIWITTLFLILTIDDCIIYGIDDTQRLNAYDNIWCLLTMQRRSF